ncbi:MAG: DMT family transporter, partial [Paracoccaceae bacterium]|nr:DMT family transporter [Paracoccaceae bacterium]
ASRCRGGANLAISDNTRGILYMNVAMATFTVNDTFMKLTTQSLPLAQAVVIRGALTVVLLLVLAQAMGGLQLRMSRVDAKLMALRTVGELGGTVLFLLALMQMPLANLSAILQSLPLAVTLAAALVMGEKVGWRRMLAIAVGFGGVLLIVRPGPQGFDVWSMMALGSVACVVLRDLVTRRFSRALPSVTVAFYAASSVLLMGLAGLVTEGWQPVTGAQMVGLSAAALALIMGYLFVVMAMRVGEVALIAPFRYSALLWAIMLGWLAFGALPDGVTLIGAAVVVASGLYTYLREYQVQRRLAASARVAEAASVSDP